MAVIAFFLSAGAFAVSIWSVIVSKRAASAAEDAAASAATSAVADSKVAQVELDRDHYAYEPKLPRDGFAIEVQRNNGNVENIVYEFTPGRTYLMEVSAVHGESAERHVVQERAVMRAGVPAKLYVEGLRPAREMPTVDVLEFKFWPASAAEGADEEWWCRCGRSLDPAFGAHWPVKLAVPAFDGASPRERFVG